MRMGKLPLVSEIMAQSLERTVDILNAIQSGPAAGKAGQESPRGETEPPVENKEDSNK